MGCLGVDPEIEKIVNEVPKKSPDIIKPFTIKKDEIENKKKSLIEEREKKVSETKDAKEEELEKLLKEYNIKELEIEKELIVNEVEKMYALWELGLELSQPLQNYTIDTLKKKLAVFPEAIMAIQVYNPIEAVKAYSPVQFLNSSYGKPLKTALIKHGMSKEELKQFKNDLLKDRKNRRKEERDKYEIKKNEFPPEDEFEFDINDLYNTIFEEYKDKNEFKSGLLKKISK